MGLLIAAVPAQGLPRDVRDGGALQRDVEAVRDTGVVGAGASGARGSARAGRGVPLDGRFRAGSVSKTFTAAVALQLVGEGRLSLDDTVEKWLPGVVRGNGNDGRLVTVRQLLQHTSGLVDPKAGLPALSSAAGYRAERFRRFEPEELVALSMRERPAFRPGKGWTYSNTNYILAAMVIREVTGRSWGREVDARIVRPLGLTGTSVPKGPYLPRPHARGYTSFGTGTAVDVTVLDPSMAVGSGAVVSTTRDLREFYAALLGGRLLEPAQLAEMTATMDAPELGPELKYGLGLGEIPLSCGGSFYGHQGDLLGYQALAGAVTGGTRSAAVYVTGDGGPRTQEAMLALVDRELCGGR
ncbi:serine hydrolase domain-containing protein [Streptomyces sp. NPDC050504]|uniref:serine hydrolase domain-containing protein n=1 Tax=Streptomyces sp. NPDC050504 TaxID=3365618 RepID=UPI00378947CF